MKQVLQGVLASEALKVLEKARGFGELSEIAIWSYEDGISEADITLGYLSHADADTAYEGLAGVNRKLTRYGYSTVMIRIKLY